MADDTDARAPLFLRLSPDGTLAASRRELFVGERYRLVIETAAALAEAALVDAHGAPLAVWNAAAEGAGEPALDLVTGAAHAALWGRSWAYRAPVSLFVRTAAGDAASVSLDLRQGTNAAVSAEAPTVQTDTALRWHERCALLVVTPPGALAADAAGWPEGRQLFCRITFGADATLPEGVTLVGYGRLQNVTTYQATAWNVGGRIYLSPILAEEAAQ